MRQLILDTSVIVRFLTRDIETQFQESKDIFMEIEDQMAVGYISLLTLQELLWTLEHSYTIPREDFVPKLITLFSLKNIKFIDSKKSFLFEILEEYKNSAFDFSQVYLLKVKGDKLVATFDRQLLKAQS